MNARVSIVRTDSFTKKYLNCFLLAAALCVVATSCIKENHEVLVMMASGLEDVNGYWVKHGRPKDFNPMNVVRSTAERYYVFTNEVTVADTTYHCRFAARSERVRIPGAMAITDEGMFLWIRDKDGKVTVSPLTNGIK